MKKGLIIGIIVVVLIGVIVGVYFYPSGKTITTLEQYYEQIDYSCQNDEDCLIKDVHNCCGFYPRCTNKNALVNGELVSEFCENEGVSSVCGFPSIDYCACENNKCVGKMS